MAISLTTGSPPACSHTASTSASPKASNSPARAFRVSASTRLSSSPLLRACSRSVSRRSCLPTPCFRPVAAQTSLSSLAVKASSSARLHARASPSFLLKTLQRSCASASCCSRASTMSMARADDFNPRLSTRCRSSSTPKALSLALRAAAASSRWIAATTSSTRSSFLHFPGSSPPFWDSCCFSSSIDIARSSFFFSTAAASSCSLSSLARLREASFASNASTMSVGCFGASSSTSNSTS
mmetsp:Transcript_74819/g.173358  ORF Transcript_74819/g.173358 Transcript_74819/m.173358 type:complete len:240 (+) Transcript_74819:178-897(+)